MNYTITTNEAKTGIILKERDFELEVPVWQKEDQAGVVLPDYVLSMFGDGVLRNVTQFIGEAFGSKKVSVEFL